MLKEVELLSSCATKTFMKFLEDKQKEIPMVSLYSKIQCFYIAQPI